MNYVVDFNRRLFKVNLEFFTGFYKKVSFREIPPVLRFQSVDLTDLVLFINDLVGFYLFDWIVVR